MGTTLQVSGLRKEFRSRTRKIIAVDDIEFVLEEGEVLGFLGPNGAGKTTTIKMLCGLIKPTRGSIWVNGHQLAVRPRQALLGVSAVLEGNRNTYWRLTVAENLEYFAHIRGHASFDLQARMDRLLASLGLTDKRNDTVQTLSRGMQQKVALACALITDPKVLLLDEPTLGLDLQSSLAIQQEIRRLVNEEGKAILLTTHQMDIAHALSDRVAIINHGRIVALDRLKSLLGLFSLGVYEIRVDGHLPPEQQTRLQEAWNAQLNCDEFGTTLHLMLEDVHYLYDVIEMLRPSGLPILTAQRVEPNLGEIYLKLVEEEKVEAASFSP